MVIATTPKEITELLNELVPNIPNTTLSEGELMARLLKLDKCRVEAGYEGTLRSIILTDYCYHTLQYEKGTTGVPTQYKRLVMYRDAKPPFNARKKATTTTPSQPASQPKSKLATWRKLNDVETDQYQQLIKDVVTSNGTISVSELDSITITVVDSTREIDDAVINRNNAIKGYLTKLASMKDSLINQTNYSTAIMVNCAFTKLTVSAKEGLVNIPELTIDDALEYLPATAQRIYWEARQTATP